MTGMDKNDVAQDRDKWSEICGINISRWDFSIRFNAFPYIVLMFIGMKSTGHLETLIFSKRNIKIQFLLHRTQNFSTENTKHVILFNGNSIKISIVKTLKDTNECVGGVHSFKT